MLKGARGGAAVEFVQLLMAAGLSVSALLMLLGAVRLHRRARQLLAEARDTIEKAKTVHAEVERLNTASRRMHTDAVRLLAEADQLATDARNEYPRPDDNDDD